MGNVGDNSVSSYQHASETQQLPYVPIAGATPVRYLYGVAMGQPSTKDLQLVLATQRLRYTLSRRFNAVCVSRLHYT